MFPKVHQRTSTWSTKRKFRSSCFAWLHGGKRCLLKEVTSQQKTRSITMTQLWIKKETALFWRDWKETAVHVGKIMWAKNDGVSLKVLWVWVCVSQQHQWEDVILEVLNVGCQWSCSYQNQLMTVLFVSSCATHIWPLFIHLIASNSFICHIFFEIISLFLFFSGLIFLCIWTCHL